MSVSPIFDTDPVTAFPRLVFDYGFDEREEFEAEARGFRSHVTVEFENGDCFPVFFYAPVTLQQELENGLRSNIPCVAEPGMIVVPAVTLKCMREAIARLIQEKFFEHLRPIEVKNGS